MLLLTLWQEQSGSISSVARRYQSHVSVQHTVRRNKAEHHHIAHHQTATPERENETDCNKKVPVQKKTLAYRGCAMSGFVLLFSFGVCSKGKSSFTSKARNPSEEKKQLVCL